MQGATVKSGFRANGPVAGRAAERLLNAAEGIVLGSNPEALTIRAIASASGLNSALISYHFGGIDGLLARLLELNVEALCTARLARITSARAVRGKRQQLEALVAGVLEPLWMTPPVWHPGSARTIIRALVPRLPPELRRASVERINQNLAEASAPLLQALPHLDSDTLQVRLQLLAGASDELRLRARNLGLFPLRAVEGKKHEEILRRELLALAVATLKLKPAPSADLGPPTARFR